MLEILLGQIPEAIFFALFIIFTKRLKTKRLVFTIMTIVEYLLLFTAFPYSIWSHILFFVVEYLLLKLLYKQLAQITDVFTLGISSIAMMILSGILYVIFWKLTNNFLLYICVLRVVSFIMLFALGNKLYLIQALYKKMWNRNDTKRKPMKSTTFRALNIVVLNVSFFIINFGMLFSLILGRR